MRNVHHRRLSSIESILGVSGRILLIASASRWQEVLGKWRLRGILVIDVPPFIGILSWPGLVLLASVDEGIAILTIILKVRVLICRLGRLRLEGSSILGSRMLLACMLLWCHGDLPPGRVAPRQYWACKRVNVSRRKAQVLDLVSNKIKLLCFKKDESGVKGRSWSWWLPRWARWREMCRGDVKRSKQASVRKTATGLGPCPTRLSFSASRKMKGKAKRECEAGDGLGELGEERCVEVKRPKYASIRKIATSLGSRVQQD
jgi:hypothetical protein